MRYILICAALILCLLCTPACRQGSDLAGKYQAAGHSDQGGQLQLVLRSDGKGAWKVDREETSFIWEQKGDEILLHSKTGGVIVGKLGKNDSIEISLPGMESFQFIRFEK